MHADTLHAGLDVSYYTDLLRNRREIKCKGELNAKPLTFAKVHMYIFHIYLVV